MRQPVPPEPSLDSGRYARRNQTIQCPSSPVASVIGVECDAFWFEEAGHRSPAFTLER